MNNSYLRRHEESLKSSKLLIDNHSHYCNSIHCSYYSVFQYLLYFHKIRGSQVFRNRDKLIEKGSHDLVIASTYSILCELDEKQANYFRRTIFKLKDERVVADYKEHHIDLTRSVVAYELAERLIQIISDTINSKK